MAALTFSQRELWGTVSNGGNFGHGYIFKTDSIGNDLVIVHHFDSINGLNPGALLAASNNKLYGLTASGGQNASSLFSGGVFYEYDLTTGVFTVLQHFGQANTQITGSFPAGDGLRTLTEVSPGLIYGQIRSAYQGGVIFAYNTTTQTIATALTLPTFQGGASNQTMGNRLEGTLYPAPDGFLYGTTYTNSQCPIPNPNLGSVIRIDPVTHAFSIRYLSPCNGTNGYQFDNQFTAFSGQLYSVTKIGGANNKGVIYAFNPATSAYTNKYDFQGGLLGEQPSTMVKMTNGKFYGTAYGGTPEPNLASGGGILFEFDPTLDQFTKKLDFVYGNGSYLNVGAFPFSLIDGNNGKLYGVTGNGVFEYDPTLNETAAKGRFPIGMGWYPPATPSLTAVCRKPSCTSLQDTTVLTCSGSGLSFDLQSDNTLTYAWTHNGTPDNTQTTGDLTFSSLTTADEGTWICEMTNICGTTTGPAIQLVVNTNTPMISQVDAELHATTADNYQWIDCDNGSAPINGETNLIFSPVSNGNYAVITTIGNCRDTSACYALVDLGLNSPEAMMGISVFPNPATSELQLLTDGSQIIASVTVISTTGQVVLQSKSTTLGVGALKPGTYLLIVETKSGSQWHGKFVKTGS